MRLEKFTEKAQEALQEAAALARSLGQQGIEPEHLILALIRQEGGVGRTLMERAGVSVQALEPALGERRWPAIHFHRATEGPGPGRAGSRETQGRVHLDRASAACAGRHQDA